MPMCALCDTDLCRARASGSATVSRASEAAAVPATASASDDEAAQTSTSGEADASVRAVVESDGGDAAGPQAASPRNGGESTAIAPASYDGHNAAGPEVASANATVAGASATEAAEAGAAAADADDTGAAPPSARKPAHALAPLPSHVPRAGHGRLHTSHGPSRRVSGAAAAAAALAARAHDDDGEGAGVAAGDGGAGDELVVVPSGKGADTVALIAALLQDAFPALPIIKFGETFRNIAEYQKRWKEIPGRLATFRTCCGLVTMSRERLGSRRCRSTSTRPKPGFWSQLPRCRRCSRKICRAKPCVLRAMA